MITKDVPVSGDGGMREGDVYRWYFKNDEEYRRQKQASGTAYWCMDNQAVVKDGVLNDTYWSYNLERFPCNTRQLEESEVDLEFVCNLSDVRIIHKSDRNDYDIVYDLSYQQGCRTLLAVDKGSHKSDKALKVKYRREIEGAMDIIQYQLGVIGSALRDLEELR